MVFKMYEVPEIPKRIIPTEFDTGRTMQSFKDECDINQILRKFQVQGVLNHVNNHSGSYSDVSNIDFAESVRTVTRVRQMFDELPSTVRKRFDHNPESFLEFINSNEPDAINEAVDLGLRPGSDRISSADPGDSSPGAGEQPPAGQQESESPA